MGIRMWDCAIHTWDIYQGAVMIRWYKIYRIRKTILRKLSDFNGYLKPMCNPEKVMKLAATEWIEICELRRELKRLKESKT
jgi:hypothetical protein